MVSNISVVNQKSTRMGLFQSISDLIVIFKQIVFLPSSSAFLLVPERLPTRLSGSKKSHEHECKYVLIIFEKYFEVVYF